jgi:hypothetical protein
VKGNPLELDIYFPKIKYAFEYQGKQHFSRVSVFQKSEEDFKMYQGNDTIKREMCPKLGNKR